MGTIPTTENGAVKSADEIIGAVIYDGAVTAAEVSLEAAFPFLAIPGISGLLDLALRFIAKYVYAGLADFATIQIIDFQTNSERNAYAKAEGVLRAAHASGDPVALQAATLEFKAAFQSLVHLDGSASY